MKTKYFKAGDIVYDDVKVPEGNEFCEEYDEENREMRVIWYKGGVYQKAVRASESVDEKIKPNYRIWTEKEMEKFLISGFMHRIADQKRWGIE